MNTTERLQKAVREHARVSELRAILCSETTAQLQYESDMEHEQGMDMHGLSSTVERICEWASSGPLGFKLVKADSDEIGRQINRLLLLQSALQA